MIATPRGRPKMPGRTGFCAACGLPAYVVTSSYSAKRETVHDSTVAQALVAAVLQRLHPTHLVRVVNS